MRWRQYRLELSSRVDEHNAVGVFDRIRIASPGMNLERYRELSGQVSELIHLAGDTDQRRANLPEKSPDSLWCVPF